jgi:ankyrin repeat protein
VVKCLLEAGIDVVNTDKFGTALHGAVRSGHTEVLDMLLVAGANISAQDRQGFTPLHSAAQGGQLPAIHKLLAANAGILVQDHQGWIPLHHAAAYGHCDVLDALLNHTNIQDMSGKLQPDFVSQIDLRTKYGLSALHLAVLNNHEDVVKRLLHAKADTSILSPDSCTPLHTASWSGHDAIVKYLLLAKADPSGQTNDDPKRTALILAASYGHVSIVRQLLDANANVAIADRFGSTALHCAAHGGFRDVVELLLKSDINPFARDCDGETALHCAAATGSIDVVDLLLDRTAEDRNKLMSMESTTGLVALHCASGLGHHLVVEKLLGFNAFPFAKDQKGKTPLHFASEGGRDSVVMRLLQVEGIDPTPPDENGQSPLHLASIGGHLNVARTLIKAGADIGSTNVFGYTPLHVAGYFNQSQIIVELLNTAGIDCPSDWDTTNTDESLNETASVEFLIKIFPSDHVLLHMLGETFCSKQEYEKAADTFDKIVSLHPANLEAIRITDIVHFWYACYGCHSQQPHGYLYKCNLCCFHFCQICADDPGNVHRDHGFLVIPSKRWVSGHLVVGERTDAMDVSHDGDNLN